MKKNGLPVGGPSFFKERLVSRRNIYSAYSIISDVLGTFGESCGPEMDSKMVSLKFLC